MLTPQQVTDKWANNTANAGEAYKAGINAVTDSQMVKAAAAADRYQSGVMRAVASNKYQNGLLRVSISDWKSAAINKGANRLSTGVTQAKSKFAAFMGEFLPFLDGLKTQLQSMPRGDINQNKARMNAAVDYIAGFRRRV